MSENDAADDISVSVDAHVAIVEIRRPPDNFFDFWLMRALADVYESLDDDPQCRAIVLCSEGKHFCAGANLQARETWSEERLESQAGNLYVEAVRLFRAGKPVVAAVQGAAVGGGLGLALSADFRVTCEECALLGQLLASRLSPGFGLSVTLPRLIGAAQAELLLLTGRRVNGTEAYRLGLAEELVPLERVRERALELAGEIAQSAPLALRAIRATQRGGLAEEIARATDHELAEQSRLRRSEDFAEGVKAMGERRLPRFTGR